MWHNPFHFWRLSPTPRLATRQTLRRGCACPRFYGMDYRTIVMSLIATIIVVTVVSAPCARAEDSVTYEVLSQNAYVNVVDVEFYDHSQRIALTDVALPWRHNVSVVSARSQAEDGAQVRADWRPAAGPSRWVTVRIYVRGALICEDIMDAGSATCHGSKPSTT